MFFKTTGSDILTGDGSVGTSGEPVRVFCTSHLSGATAGDLVLRNGTSASDTAYVTVAGAINDTVITEYGANGLLFPNGCWFDKDTNVTHVVVEFRVES